MKFKAHLSEFICKKKSSRSSVYKLLFKRSTQSDVQFDGHSGFKKNHGTTQYFLYDCGGQQTLDNDTPSKVTICRQGARFKRGDMRLEDVERSGSSKGVTNPDIVETDRDVLRDEKWK